MCIEYTVLIKNNNNRKSQNVPILWRLTLPTELYYSVFLAPPDRNKNSQKMSARFFVCICGGIGDALGIPGNQDATMFASIMHDIRYAPDGIFLYTEKDKDMQCFLM